MLLACKWTRRATRTRAGAESPNATSTPTTDVAGAVPRRKNPETQPRLESFTLMHLYRDRVLPHLIHFAMRNRELAAYRARIVPHAEGRVLEIGIGSGLNLPFYADRADEVLGLEPSGRLVEMARGAAASSRLSVTFLEATAEQIPLDESTIDTVVTAWTLCSIPDVSRALGEIRRVLRPGGQLLFVEHGLSPEERVRKWQNRLTPVWKLLSGGCHLNRPITRLIEDAGFRIDTLNTAYMRGPKLATFMYEGIARQR